MKLFFKKLFLVFLSVFLFYMFLVNVNAMASSSETPSFFVSPVEQDNWASIYYYTDDEVHAKIENLANNKVEIVRTYAWKGSPFKHIYLGKVQIKKFDTYKYITSEAKYWSSPRMTIINPKNELERYELRFMPEKDKLQVNYVDRTGRTGYWNIDKYITTSEVLAQVDCEIEPKEWYYTVISKNNNRWRAIVFSAKHPTCILDWKDDRIKSNKYLVGIQSAGKYIVSRFEDVKGI